MVNGAWNPRPFEEMRLLKQMVPMQAGTREGGMAVALKILGISSATGIMGGLIYRIRDLLCTTVGILLILTGRKKDKANAAAPEEKHEQTDSE